jgi:CheY-like chemotaxis protein
VAGTGSGLGLSIALQICRAMGGELTCESRVGVGSVFRFALPLTLAAPLAPSLAEPPGYAAEPADDETPLSGTVLLVDDNPVNVIVAQAELELLGLRVEVATNGQLALDWLARHEADLILMDCHMPEMDGYTATRHIRETEARQQRPAVPIVALTATTQDEELLKCKAAGMNDYLCKPFTTHDMKRMLRRYLPLHA